MLARLDQVGRRAAGEHSLDGGPVSRVMVQRLEHLRGFDQHLDVDGVAREPAVIEDEGAPRGLSRDEERVIAVHQGIDAQVVVFLVEQGDGRKAVPEVGDARGVVRPEQGPIVPVRADVGETGVPHAPRPGALPPLVGPAVRAVMREELADSGRLVRPDQGGPGVDRARGRVQVRLRVMEVDEGVAHVAVAVIVDRPGGVVFPDLVPERLEIASRHAGELGEDHLVRRVPEDDARVVAAGPHPRPDPRPAIFQVGRDVDGENVVPGVDRRFVDDEQAPLVRRVENEGRRGLHVKPDGPQVELEEAVDRPVPGLARDEVEALIVVELAVLDDIGAHDRQAAAVEEEAVALDPYLPEAEAVAPPVEDRTRSRVDDVGLEDVKRRIVGRPKPRRRPARGEIDGRGAPRLDRHGVGAQLEADFGGPVGRCDPGREADRRRLPAGVLELVRGGEAFVAAGGFDEDVPRARRAVGLEPNVEGEPPPAFIAVEPDRPAGGARGVDDGLAVSSLDLDRQPECPARPNEGRHVDGERDPAADVARERAPVHGHGGDKIDALEFDPQDFRPPFLGVGNEDVPLVHGPVDAGEFGMRVPEIGDVDGGCGAAVRFELPFSIE